MTVITSQFIGRFVNFQDFSVTKCEDQTLIQSLSAQIDSGQALPPVEPPLSWLHTWLFMFMLPPLITSPARAPRGPGLARAAWGSSSARRTSKVAKQMDPFSFFASTLARWSNLRDRCCPPPPLPPHPTAVPLADLWKYQKGKQMGWWGCGGAPEQTPLPEVRYLGFCRIHWNWWWLCSVHRLNPQQARAVGLSIFEGM